ncbi:MAG: HU family DNA-binding protein [Bacteroidales bacterium]|nr:HU family DNA-binding protein [Candidatus Equimonas faecalis]
MIKYYVKEGKNPKTGAAMFYAMPAPVTTIKLEFLAEEISQECTVTAHDIRAVISAMEEKIIGHLQNGQSVRLGLLGSFCPTLRSTAAPSPELFVTDNIKAIGTSFTPSSTMKYQLGAGNPKVQFQRMVEE